MSDSPGRSITGGAAVVYQYPNRSPYPPASPACGAALSHRAGPAHQFPHAQAGRADPTTFSIPEGSGVRLVKADYPRETTLHFLWTPTRNSVCTRRIHNPDTHCCESGNHLVEAKLRYQACDRNVCMPPKTITVPIDVIGK